MSTDVRSNYGNYNVKGYFIVINTVISDTCLILKK